MPGLRRISEVSLEVPCTIGPSPNRPCTSENAGYRDEKESVLNTNTLAMNEGRGRLVKNLLAPVLSGQLRALARFAARQALEALYELVSRLF